MKRILVGALAIAAASIYAEKKFKVSEKIEKLIHQTSWDDPDDEDELDDELEDEENDEELEETPIFETV